MNDQEFLYKLEIATKVCLRAALMTTLFVLLMLLCCEKIYAETISEQKAVACILGEASDQGFDGMVAVGAALRNRGTTKGVYGCNAKHIYKEPKWVWKMAEKAWRSSENYDPTFGATHWESDRFKTPYWAKEMVITIKIKNHVFYKRRNK